MEVAAARPAAGDVPTGSAAAASAADDEWLSGAEEALSEDENELRDVTAEAHRAGKDIQGIPWDHLMWSREGYRQRRLEQYPNYHNQQQQCEEAAEALAAEALHVSKDSPLFSFFRNFRACQSSIVHFQLRNLVAATSKHDVYLQHNNCVTHWNLLNYERTPVLDVGSGVAGGPAAGLGRVQISTMAVAHGLLAAGGFNGELLVKRLAEDRVACSTRVTTSENGITNGIEIVGARAGATCIATANNDALVRLFDANTFEVVRRFEFPFAVNFATFEPTGRRLVAVVGDDPAALLLDADSGARVARLEGHYDFSFAAAWHPNGQVVATGNQDKSVRLWDIRYPATSLALLQARMGAVRALRYSPDGRFLAAAEPADFVLVYDAAAGYTQCQEIDLFGEIAGIAFAPGCESLFVGVADLTYGSLLQFDRCNGTGLDAKFALR